MSEVPLYRFPLYSLEGDPVLGHTGRATEIHLYIDIFLYICIYMYVYI